MIYWLLAREVMILRGELKKGMGFWKFCRNIDIDENWDVMADMFYYKDIEKLEEEQEDNIEGDLDVVIYSSI